MVQSDSCANVLPQCGTEVLSDLKQVRVPKVPIGHWLTDGSSLCESSPQSSHYTVSHFPHIRPVLMAGGGGITCNWQTAQYPVSSRLERER